MKNMVKRTIETIEEKKEQATKTIENRKKRKNRRFDVRFYTIKDGFCKSVVRCYECSKRTSEDALVPYILRDIMDFNQNGYRVYDYAIEEL